MGAGVQSLGFDPGDEGTANDDAPTQRSITDYQGQVLGGSSPWTFRNVTPNSQAVYDVYVSGSTDKTQGDYTIGGTAGGTPFTLPSSAWGTDPRSRRQ